MFEESCHPLGPLLAGFLNEHVVHERGLSRLTRSSYSQTFILLLRYMKERAKKDVDLLTLEDVTPEQVSAFLNFLEREQGNTTSTRNLRLAALRSFFRYVGSRIPATLDQSTRVRLMRAKKMDRPVIDWLTTQETAAVLRAPDPAEPDGLLDRAMLLLTYVCGLRVAEALALPLSDLDLGPRPAVHILGKGRRARVLPLAANTVRNIRAWVAIRPTVPSDHVFVNRYGLPLTRDAFAIRLAKYVKVASETVPSILGKRVTPHVLRHSCAMHMLKETRDIRKVSLWLGHASLSTTETYLRADPEEKLEILTARGDLGIRAGKFSAKASAIMSMLQAARDGSDGLRAVPRLKKR